MVGILEFSRYERFIERELIRRIGYTNGLHDIFRFARVVEYLHPIISITQTSFRATIIREEKKLKTKSIISGVEYSQGIIDISRSLLLIDKIGQKLSLSDRGYALHALQQSGLKKDENIRAFLLMCVLDSDGECVLNLLDILKNKLSIKEIGENLLEDRMMKSIIIKEKWAEKFINSTLARDVILNHLEKSHEKLKNALDPTTKDLSKSRGKERLSGDERVETFFEHTITPRIRWLKDLKCIEGKGLKNYEITAFGNRLLDFFKTSRCFQEDIFILPLSPWLLKIVGIKNIADDDPNLFWHAIANAFNPTTETCNIDEKRLFELIKKIYPYLKMYGFNQAEISSVFHTLSGMGSTKGKYFEYEDELNKKIENMIKLSPDEVYHLSKRRGYGGYISLKKF
jgi:hypothetical protein